MANETTAAPAAQPVAQPAAQPAAAPVGSPASVARAQAPASPNTGAAEGRKSQAQSNLITNPTPVVSPDAPVQEAAPVALPQSTIDEMAAGRKALDRNRPVAAAIERARVETPRDSDGKATA